MDLSLSNEQTVWRQSAANFASEEARPLWNRVEMDQQSVSTMFEKAKKIGLFDAWIDEQETGFDLTTMAIIAEELAWGDGSLALILVNNYLCYRAAKLLGDAGMEKRVIELLTAASKGLETVLVWSGSDEQETVGEKALSVFDKSRNSISIKSKMSLAQAETMAYMGCVLLDSSSETYGFFLIEAGSDTAKTVIKPIETLGLQGIRFSEMSLEKELDTKDCIVEFKDKQKYQSFLKELSKERAILLASVVTGIARAGFEYALEYSKERTTFGKPISQHQAVSLRLAEMGIGLESSRLLIWEASNRDGEGRLDEELAIGAWKYSQEIAVQVAIDAVQTLGGHGYLKYHPVEKWMRDAQFLSLLYDNQDLFG